MTPKHKFAVVALAAATVLPSFAAVISLTADNGGGTSGFTGTTGWSVAAVPSAGNTYQNAGFLLRTPTTANTNFTFAGDSLTITDRVGATGFAGVANHALMWKGTGTTNNIITINNLIINGGQIRHGSGSADTFTLAGNITVGANGAGFGTQGGMLVTAPISGGTGTTDPASTVGAITIMNSGNTEAARTVFFQSAANTFAGNIFLNSSQSKLTFNNGGVANFVLGATGVNNRITVNSGATLNLDGLFKINSVSADLTPGNTWNLISGTAVYGSNFGIENFTTSDSTVWTNGAGTLQFSKLTGTVTALAAVPEPSAFAALAGLAVLGFGASRRRRA